MASIPLYTQMSRNRSSLITTTRRLRNSLPFLQASDTEIQSDLLKMKYVSPAAKKPSEFIVSVELPKKRSKPVDEDNIIIDSLIKIMKFEPVVAKKEPEKKPEAQKPAPLPNPAMANYLAIQSHMIRNSLIMSQFNLMAYPALVNFSSSADYHMKAARFIQSLKPKNVQ